VGANTVHFPRDSIAAKSYSISNSHNVEKSSDPHAMSSKA
jgi:hypothetical protein